MGVYSKDGISRTPGQDMPDNCFYDCRLIDTCLHVPRWGSEETLDRLKIERAKNCPLVEVLEPHGRLIDADAIPIHREGYDYVAYLDSIAEMPTVIEAEGE